MINYDVNPVKPQNLGFGRVYSKPIGSQPGLDFG